MTTRREFTSGSITALFMAFMVSMKIEEIPEATEDERTLADRRTSTDPKAAYKARYRTVMSDTAWMDQTGPDGGLHGIGVEWEVLVMIRDRLIPGSDLTDLTDERSFSVWMAIRQLESAIMLSCPHDSADYIYQEGVQHDGHYKGSRWLPGYKENDTVRCPSCNCTTSSCYSKAHRDEAA